ncbi:MAG: response regulator [Alphaproteobacteria bacterium]|nr:response regulator [Alphaproteobacteria bacterium]
MSGIRFDISDSMRAREDKKRAEAQLLALVANAPVSINIRDAAGRYVVASPFASTLRRIPFQDCVGRTPHQIFPKDFADKVLAEDREILATKKTLRQEQIRHDQNGERIHAVVKFPILDDAGQAIGVGVINEDITERRSAEARINHLQKLEAVGQLTAGVAHDFNNLLTVILGNLELIDQYGVDDSFKARIGRALLATGQGADLTQKLLAFGRKMPLLPVVLDVAAQAAELRSMLERTLPESIAIELPPPTLAAWVRCDRGQLESALLNLAINARDAMPAGGGLTIGISSLAVGDDTKGALDLAPGRYVAIAVRDSGSGMSPEVLARAFEPFFTTKEVGRGSGLGLSMVYGFCKQSGGTATVTSALGQGTTVTLYLPEAAAPRPGAGNQSLSNNAAEPGRRERRILLVEDDENVRNTVAEQISHAGYAVTPASDSAEGLALLGQGRPFDLLLSDIVLPGPMNGKELADHARRTYPGIRVILMSGYPRGHVGEDGAAAARYAFLQKPVQRYALMAAIETEMRTDGAG